VVPRLLAPGPVAVPPAVLEVLARPAVHHRTREFRDVFIRARARLAELLLVPGDDVMLVAGSGTSAFEAALLAAVPAGSTVVVARAGKFGERWAQLARAFALDVRDVAAPWGEVVEPDEVARALRDRPQAAALLVTHSETSTGALLDLEAVAAAPRAAVPEVPVLA
jgi:aspartate aminotransferase-like enzyme